MIGSMFLLLACGTAETPLTEEPATAHQDEAKPEKPLAIPVDVPEAAPPGPKLDLNTATSEQFATVPGVGAKMVHEFEEYRPYVSISQFRKEMAKYVDAATIAGYEQHVYVPIDPQASDAATLQQIRGLSPEEAAALIAGRPYTDRQAFLDALAQHLTPEEQSAGQALVR